MGVPGKEAVTGEEGKEEDEEEGDWGMTLAVWSKGSRGCRSLGKPCRSCDWRRKQKEQREIILLFVLVTQLLVTVISPKLTWQQDEEALSVL